MSGIKNDYDLALAIVDAVSQNPYELFPAFVSYKKSYSINKYGFYEFVFDRDTFTGDFASLAVLSNGKIHHSKRAVLSDKAFSSKAVLDKELLDFMDNLVFSKYPVLSPKNSTVNTSVGKASFSLSSFDSDGNMKVGVLIGNSSFAFSGKMEDMKDASNSREVLLGYLYTFIDKIIPDFKSPKFRSSSAMNYGGKTYNDNFEVRFSDYSAGFFFDLDAFVKTGNFIFRFSVVDNKTGLEMPKEPEEVIYRKSGVDLYSFAYRVSLDDQ